MNERALQNRVVVVTGGAGRLGRRVVNRFERAGATPVAVDVSDDALREAPLPDDAPTLTADLTSEDDVERCFAEVADRFDRLDALVHTVGTWNGQPFLETTLGDWERMMRLNLHSAFLCFREAARVASQDEGSPARLIGITSGQGADRGQARQAAYSASKAGVVRLVEAVADEFEPQALTAHAIAPSTLLFDDDGEGVPAERVADLCAYLCAEAGDALNGGVLRTYGSAF
jgi:NAD(P)-dependent dehydrogenase (short-subunit alcohol dehydrogenase family)